MTPLDEHYFQWLYSLVAPTRVTNPTQSYVKVLRIIHSTEFLWFIPNDDNRAQDGKELRPEFLEAEGIDGVDDEWMNRPCSMLELMIGLSRRLSFEGEGEPAAWFWTLMENLELERYNDKAIFPEEVIEKTLKDVIFRTYDPDGRGGFFPLEAPEKDQRKVELWYQFNAYLIEQI